MLRFHWLCNIYIMLQQRLLHEIDQCFIAWQRKIIASTVEIFIEHVLPELYASMSLKSWPFFRLAWQQVLQVAVSLNIPLHILLTLYCYPSQLITCQSRRYCRSEGFHIVPVWLTLPHNSCMLKVSVQPTDNDSCLYMNTV